MFSRPVHITKPTLFLNHPQVILAAGSPYFRSMFASGMEESRKREIELKQIEPVVFGQVLRFIYTGQVDIFSTTVQELFTQAQLFQVGLIFTCVEHMGNREMTFFGR